MSTARCKRVKFVKEKDTWLGTLSSVNDKSVIIVATLSCLVSFLCNFTAFLATGYKNQDKSWRHGTWCSLHLTLNTESLGGGSVSRYSGKLVRTLSALEQYFHRKTTQMVATVLKIPNIISFCQAKATWPQLRSSPIKTFLQYCSIMYLFLNREYISVADIEWNILGFKSSVCSMDSKLVWSRNGMSHCGEGGWRRGCCVTWPNKGCDEDQHKLWTNRMTEWFLSLPPLIKRA